MLSPARASLRRVADQYAGPAGTGQAKWQAGRPTVPFLDSCPVAERHGTGRTRTGIDRKSTRLNSSHSQISYAVFCLKKKKNKDKLCMYSKPSTKAQGSSSKTQ